MHNEWREVLTRLSVGSIVEISLEAKDARASLASSGTEADDKAAPPLPPPSATLWPVPPESGARFGVRVRSPSTSIQSEAARLAAVAIEREVTPIILSHVERSQFEQLGFRVERIHGKTAAERAMQEDELRRFWDLSIVIDIEDIAGLS